MSVCLNTGASTCVVLISTVRLSSHSSCSNVATSHQAHKHTCNVVRCMSSPVCVHPPALIKGQQAWQSSLGQNAAWSQIYLDASSTSHRPAHSRSSLNLTIAVASKYRICQPVFTFPNLSVAKSSTSPLRRCKSNTASSS